MHPIAYKLFDLRGRNPQRGGVLGPGEQGLVDIASDANRMHMRRIVEQLIVGRFGATPYHTCSPSRWRLGTVAAAAL